MKFIFSTLIIMCATLTSAATYDQLATISSPASPQNFFGNNIDISGNVLVTNRGSVNTIYAYNATTGAPISSHHYNSSSNITNITTDGRFMAVRTENSVEIIDVKTGDLLHTLSAPVSGISGASLDIDSSNGRVAFTSITLGGYKLSVYEMATGKLLAETTRPRDRVENVLGNRIEFQDGGTRLAVASSFPWQNHRGTVEVFDLVPNGGIGDPFELDSAHFFNGSNYSFGVFGASMAINENYLIASGDSTSDSSNFQHFSIFDMLTGDHLGEIEISGNVYNTLVPDVAVNDFSFFVNQSSPNSGGIVYSFDANTLKFQGPITPSSFFYNYSESLAASDNMLAAGLRQSRFIEINTYATPVPIPAGGLLLICPLLAGVYYKKLKAKK